MKNWELSRRDLLKGLGVGAGCLPLLHSSRAWSAGVGGAPKKLVIIANTEGYRMANWRPKDGALATQTLPDSSTPFEPHKADMIFLPGLTHPTFGGPRHGGFATQLTAGPNSGVNEYRVAYSASIDQVVGDAWAKTEALPRSTLNLGVLSSQGIMGEGNNSRWCIYKGKDQPVAPEQDPWKTYATIFAGAAPAPAGGTTGGTQVAVNKMMAQRKSILDYVGTDLEKFATRLGADDKVIVGGHLAALRSLEKELQALASVPPGATPAQCGTVPGGAVAATDGLNFPALVKAQIDLMVAALRCGVTRVTTLQMVDAGGGHIPVNFLPGLPAAANTSEGYNNRWHGISHTPISGGVDVKSIMDKWCNQQFAMLLDKMKAIAEPGGNMLSNSIVLITNHMEDGANHDTQKLPWMIAGSGQGYFKTGQCALSTGKPIGGVLAHVHNALVPTPVTYFGDATYGKPWEGLQA